MARLAGRSLRSTRPGGRAKLLEFCCQVVKIFRLPGGLLNQAGVSLGRLVLLLMRTSSGGGHLASFVAPGGRFHSSPGGSRRRGQGALWWWSRRCALHPWLRVAVGQEGPVGRAWVWRWNLFFSGAFTVPWLRRWGLLLLVLLLLELSGRMGLGGCMGLRSLLSGLLALLLLCVGSVLLFL